MGNLTHKDLDYGDGRTNLTCGEANGGGSHVRSESEIRDAGGW